MEGKEERMKEWIKHAILFALAIFAVYGFMTIRQQSEALALMRQQTLQLNDALRQQCETLLDRAGYNVQLTPKTPLPAEALPQGAPNK
jgi:hypothetical protein